MFNVGIIRITFKLLFIRNNIFLWNFLSQIICNFFYCLHFFFEFSVFSLKALSYIININSKFSKKLDKVYDDLKK
jgi:hypothetical protein